MAELPFLSAVASHLAAAGLTPAPATLGVVEPGDGAALPAVVLSLESSERLGQGVGERAALVAGALPWQATIDLAHPVLPEDASVVLLDAARTGLTLPHGGLVTADGDDGPLGAGDLTVTVNGTPRPVVTGLPVDDQVRADPTIGRLTFATPLPPAGTVAVRYFLGAWERRVERIAGVLRADACAAIAADAAALGGAVVTALLDPAARTAIVRLVRVALQSLGSVGLAEPAPSPAVRRRTARFAFVYEHEIDRPESSGGVIARIPIVTRLGVATVDAATGAVGTTIVTVP